MKKIWSAPEAIAEQFAANEYVAACGVSGVVYKFTCDAPKGDVYYYNESGDKRADKVFSGSLVELGGSKPCGEYHEAESTADFFDGFVDRNDNGRCDADEQAIIWVEFGNTFFGYGAVDWHATSNLDKNTWETAKS